MDDYRRYVIIFSSQDSIILIASSSRALSPFLSLSFLSRDHPPLNAPTKARNTAFRGAAKGRRSGVVETMRARRPSILSSFLSRVEFKFHSTEKRVSVLAVVFLSFSTKLYLTTKRIVFVVYKATNVRNKRREVNNRKALFCRVIERAFENSLTRRGEEIDDPRFFPRRSRGGEFCAQSHSTFPPVDKPGCIQRMNAPTVP